MATKAVKPKLTKSQRAKVRSLIEDEAYTRAEAVAYVLHFEPDGVK